MTTAHKSPAHLVFAGNEAYGHIQGGAALAAKLVQVVQPTPIITIIVTEPRFMSRFETNIAKFQLEPALRTFIRIICFGRFTQDFVAIKEAVNALEASEAIKCRSSGIEYAAAPPPSVLVFDFFAYQIFAHFRARAQQNNRKILGFAWVAGGAAGFLRYFGPENLGGVGDLDAKMTAAGAIFGVLTDRKAIGVIGDPILLPGDDRLVDVPGLPPMYNYEHLMQEVPHIPGISMIARFGYKSLVECDGAILANSESIEPDSFPVWRDWFAESNREVFVIPLAQPPKTKIDTRAASEINSSDTTIDQISAFLDSAVEKSGVNSVVYITFGSHFFPWQTDRVWTLFDALIESKIPFIFSYPVPSTTVPSEVVEKVKASGLGLMSAWAPQQYILSHPALGWFVTHAGHNGRMESLAAGVPMICWPIHSEQFFNAAQLSTNLNVAYELLQVHSGPQAGKPIRRLELLGTDAPKFVGTLEAVRKEFFDVLEKARGQDGDIKRANARRIQQAMVDEWKTENGQPIGSGLKAILAFAKQATLL